MTAIDIDPAAARQAAANFAASPFADRLEALCQPLQDFEAEAGAFDGIVCNPPFYVDALKCPDGRRSLARHADTLPFAFLVKSAARLLAADGCFSLVLPLGALKAVEAEAIFVGLSPSRRTLVRTTASKPPKRALVEFAKTYRGDVEQREMVIGDETHARITRGFLLPKNL